MSLSIENLTELFADVQHQNVLGDGKTFPDCIPKKTLTEIQQQYEVERGLPNFDLNQFVQTHFDMPPAVAVEFKSDASRAIETHITLLWDALTRQPVAENSSLISLPHPYVVPGGRFREIYYWDSYFTMLGLRACGKNDLIEHMVNNFAFLINQVGYIPNGNRSYFLGRSQPPFFGLMVKLLQEIKQENVQNDDELEPLAKYAAPLHQEYQFWMKGVEHVEDTFSAQHRVVRLPDGCWLNRYWDELDTPRPEAFREDVELAASLKDQKKLYRHIRAAAESGWDFSTRWFKNSEEFSSIHTTDIIPIDLNCLLYDLEKTISESAKHEGNAEKSRQFLAFAEKRKLAIRKYCWSDQLQFFVDYDFVSREQKSSLTLAGAFPLFFNLATPDQAMGVAEILETHFLKRGGLTTTLTFSGQQWDAPNGWAPLQWIAYRGLLNYGFDELAEKIKTRWMSTLESVYRQTGKLTEKYDVWNEHAEASGGEYPNQDGFGWTNGVYMAMKNG